MTVRMSTKAALAVVFAIGSLQPLAAQRIARGPQFHPNTQKYSDAGAKPVTGRSGSASLEARALLASDGTADIEVSTGSLDAGTSIPLTAEAVHQSMNTWTGIAEAPDIPPAAKSAHDFGITANDIASALMDFHDASSDGLDQGHGWTAPAPAPAHDVLGLLQTSSQPTTAQSQTGVGIGQRHLT